MSTSFLYYNVIRLVRLESSSLDSFRKRALNRAKEGVLNDNSISKDTC